jgi:hypothetical protein
MDFSAAGSRPSRLHQRMGERPCSASQ